MLQWAPKILSKKRLLQFAMDRILWISLTLIFAAQRKTLHRYAEFRHITVILCFKFLIYSILYGFDLLLMIKCFQFTFKPFRYARLHMKNKCISPLLIDNFSVSVILIFNSIYLHIYTSHCVIFKSGTTLLTIHF